LAGLSIRADAVIEVRDLGRHCRALALGEVPAREVARDHEAERIGTR
jgi:hypothetical protein